MTLCNRTVVFNILYDQIKVKIFALI